MKTVLCVVLGVVLFGSMTLDRARADGWQNWSGNGHDYCVVYTPAGIDWLTAKAQAENMGGYLATVQSAAENQFIYSLISDPKYWDDFAGIYLNGPWLGGVQVGGPEPAGGWTWVTGEPWSYTNWAPTQPDNHDGAQNWLHYWGYPGLTASSYWDDVQSNCTTYAFIAERATVPEPTGLAGLLCGCAVFGWRWRRR